jgi:hypothetical protein
MCRYDMLKEGILMTKLLAAFVAAEFLLTGTVMAAADRVPPNPPSGPNLGARLKVGTNKVHSLATPAPKARSSASAPKPHATRRP